MVWVQYNAREKKLIIEGRNWFDVPRNKRSVRECHKKCVRYFFVASMLLLVFSVVLYAVYRDSIYLYIFCAFLLIGWGIFLYMMPRGLFSEDRESVGYFRKNLGKAVMVEGFLFYIMPTAEVEFYEGYIWNPYLGRSVKWRLIVKNVVSLGDSVSMSWI